jgi:hypothetical protein
MRWPAPTPKSASPASAPQAKAAAPDNSKAVIASAAKQSRLQARKTLLFLKKKKQKDFIHWHACRATSTCASRKSFLVLFFKKERA